MNTIYFPLPAIGGKEYKRPQITDFIFDKFNLLMYDNSDGYEKKLEVEILGIENSRMMLKFSFYMANMYGEYVPLDCMDKYNESEYQIQIMMRENIPTEKYTIPIENVKKAAQYIEAEIFMAMDYIMRNGLERQREWKISPNTKHKYSHEHRTSTTNNKIYLFDDIVRYVAENYTSPHGSHKVTCPCWEVRGHYRHYKSGKVVFVPAYRKGKQKDKVTPIPHEYYAKVR